MRTLFNYQSRTWKQVAASVVIFILALCFVGCASIVSQSTYPVTISSSPDGAEITVTDSDGKIYLEGTTPATISLDAGAGFFKGANYTVTFELPGYTKHTAEIDRGVDGWYIGGNLLFGGLIGYLIIDPATGAMWTLSDLYVDLSETTSSIYDESQVLTVVTIDEVPDELKQKLVQIR